MAYAYPLPLRRMGRHCVSGIEPPSALMQAGRGQSNPESILENPVLGGVFLCQGSGIAGPVALGSSGISGINSST